MRKQADATASILAQLPGRDRLRARLAEIDAEIPAVVSRVHRDARGRLTYLKRTAARQPAEAVPPRHHRRRGAAAGRSGRDREGDRQGARHRLVRAVARRRAGRLYAVGLGRRDRHAARDRRRHRQGGDAGDRSHPRRRHAVAAGFERLLPRPSRPGLAGAPAGRALHGPSHLPAAPRPARRRPRRVRARRARSGSARPQRRRGGRSGAWAGRRLRGRPSRRPEGAVAVPRLAEGRPGRHRALDQGVRRRRARSTASASPDPGCTCAARTTRRASSCCACRSTDRCPMRRPWSSSPIAC